MTAAEAVRRYHAAETRLAEVEALIDEWVSFREWQSQCRRGVPGVAETHPMPEEPLEPLLLERERLQAESFHVFTEARRLG